MKSFFRNLYGTTSKGCAVSIPMDVVREMGMKPRDTLKITIEEIGGKRHIALRLVDEHKDDKTLSSRQLELAITKEIKRGLPKGWKLKGPVKIIERTKR